MRRDVGVVELADRLDQVLADAAGADEAHDRCAAHVDLEAQQRVARRSSTAPAAPRRSAGSTASSRRRRSRPRPASCRCSRPPRRTACRARPWCGSRWRARRASGRGRRRRRRSARTRSPERCGRTRGSGGVQRIAAALRQVGGRRESTARSRRRRRAACRDRRSAASRRAAAASLEVPEPLGEIGPEIRPGERRDEAHECNWESAAGSRRTWRDRPRRRCRAATIATTKHARSRARAQPLRGDGVAIGAHKRGELSCSGGRRTTAPGMDARSRSSGGRRRARAQPSRDRTLRTSSSSCAADRRT